MALPKVSVSQRDFSAGEIDTNLKRDEESPIFKKGLRQCVNFRVLDSNKLGNRLGRSIKFVDGPRVDEILMAPDQVFYLVFGNGFLVVKNVAGANVFGTFLKGDLTTPIPWTTTTVKSIRWDIYQHSIYIAYADGFPNNVPQILTWDGVSQTSSWSFTTFTEEVVGAQKRTPFYRLAQFGMTLTPSAATGTGITLTTSSPYFVAGMVGTYLRYIGRQILITAVTGPTTATGDIKESLFQAIALTVNNGGHDIRDSSSIGDVIIGSQSGSKIQIEGYSSGTGVNGQLLNGNLPQVASSSFDVFVGPGGSIGVATGFGLGPPDPVTIWDEEVMNNYRGWPSSVSVDQGRLIFCNFPSIRSGIAWSAIGVLNDLYVIPVGISPANAIFEICPSKNQVQDVVPGNEGSEFVFCDNAIFAIPINVTNPLTATSGVAFNRITDDGAKDVRPQRMQNIIVYINADAVCGLMTTGAYYRANESRDLTSSHYHLIKDVIAIACPTANDPLFPERYIYVLNDDGTLAVGSVDITDGNIRANTMPSWVPETGTGDIKWISARASNVMMTTLYPSATGTVAELRDFNQYLDTALLYNAVPPALTPPAGKGPLWWMAGGTCDVLDNGTRQMGTYQIDANGFLVPQFFGGENLASPLLTVGQAWIGIVEPFIPVPGPGQDQKQRMVRIKVARASCYVIESTGFLWQRLFSGPLVPVTSPAYKPLGTVIGTRRVATYNQDDDATQPPPLREGAEFWRPLGRSFDPRLAIVKDTAGPLVILEIGAEVTV